MMRSWENRVDCEVIDEPFYAFYLSQTQSPHPLFDEILHSQSIDYSQVAMQLSDGPCKTEVQYQKHMTHHMLNDVDLSWTKDLRHCFLIRDPAQVVNSYTNSRGLCSAEDIGIIRQAELYHEISRITGQVIPVIDSNEVLKDPQCILSELCRRLDVAFDPNMLTWPAGARCSDGVWAKHWYHSVEKSTGFAKYSASQFSLNADQLDIVEQVKPHYEQLSKLCIKIPVSNLPYV
jgi:hypothetical protein